MASHNLGDSSRLNVPVFVAKQPIFDRASDIWGYELLFRDSSTAKTASVVDGDAATSAVIADGFSLAQPTLATGDQILINFPQNLLLDGTARALPPEHCVIEMLETVEPTPELLTALRELKEEGYRLALDDFVGEERFAPLLDLADIIKVDVLGMDAQRIREVSQPLLQKGKTLLAEKVENMEVFETTRDLGYMLFQGFFFAKPVIIPGRKITGSQVTKLRLMQELDASAFDVRKLADIIGKDVSLSYRLLRYVNSAAFGLASPVNTIQQAIMLVGQKQLTQWLRVAILADMQEGSTALAELSVSRGRFLENVGNGLKNAPLTPDAMFLLGLFSMLDVALGIPMKDILAHLPLDPVMREALLGQLNQARFWLDMARAIETADWSTVMHRCNKYRIPLKWASDRYNEAMGFTALMLAGQERKGKRPNKK